jgi:hypothetical protein
VRKALGNAESSMAALVDANRGLLKALSKAGTSMTSQARKEFNARVRKLDKGRASARKQLNDLVKRLKTLRR